MHRNKHLERIANSEIEQKLFEVGIESLASGQIRLAQWGGKVEPDNEVLDVHSHTHSNTNPQLIQKV